MKKRNIRIATFVFSLIVIVTGCLPEAALAKINNSKWTSSYIKNVGWIDYPPTMELQTADYRKQVGGKENANIVIFQQKGLNQGTPAAYLQYSRLIVEVIQGDPGDFLRISDADEIMKASKEDLEYLNNSFLAELEKQRQVKVIDFYGYRSVKVGGKYPAFSVIYKRESTVSENKGSVMVRVFLISNYKQLIKITVSYRAKEEDLWKEELIKAVDLLVLEKEY